MTKHPELPLAKRVQKKGLPYLLLLPAMALFVAFTFYPFVKTIVLSFALTDKQGNFTKWIGIGNWIRILGKESFWQTILITLKMSAINLTGTIVIAMIFALLANKKVRFSKLYQTMYALPMAIASSPAAAIFLFIYRQKTVCSITSLAWNALGCWSSPRQSGAFAP